jgi:hypothetical protein
MSRSKPSEKEERTAAGRDGAVPVVVRTSNDVRESSWTVGTPPTVPALGAACHTGKSSIAP